MVALGKRRVLITGISGFTGRHLARALGAAGWNVLGLGRHRLAVETDHLDADLAETTTIRDWLSKVRPTHIIHLAALSHVVGDPLAFYRVNVLGTESLLEAVSQSDIRPLKVLIASSANIYGNASRSPITEDAPARPANHYALSKAAMELLLYKWFDRLPIIIARPFNYTGPGQSEAFLLPKIVAAHRRRDRSIKLGNLYVARDFSDVSFVCEAYRCLLLSSAGSTAFNVCSGRSISIAEVLREMADISGYSPAVEVDPALVRKDEIIELRGDPTKLREQIGHLETWSLRRILERMYIHPDVAPIAGL